ncbi:hypothetical protein Aduo_004983 [Ancylostoma duodenale]
MKWLVLWELSTPQGYNSRENGASELDIETLQRILILIPESTVTPYQNDLDDYRTELMRGTQFMREEMEEHASKYREIVKSIYGSRYSVSGKRSPKVDERVFMKLPTESRKGKHPKLVCEWEGPYRVLESSENSALTTKIGVDARPRAHKRATRSTAVMSRGYFRRACERKDREA